MLDAVGVVVAVSSSSIRNVRARCDARLSRSSDSATRCRCCRDIIDVDDDGDVDVRVDNVVDDDEVVDVDDDSGECDRSDAARRRHSTTRNGCPPPNARPRLRRTVEKPITITMGNVRVE